ncbi:MAG TPA: response regulator, partial [Kofleriaceae bacterium]
ILIVEDQEDLRDAIADALRMAGHEVVAADGGDQALAALDDAITPFDVLLTDLVMPRLSGRELAEQVQARWPKVQVMFMSGYDRDLLADAARELRGDIAVLRKPFSIGELERRVAQLVRTARG